MPRGAISLASASASQTSLDAQPPPNSSHSALNIYTGWSRVRVLAVGDDPQDLRYVRDVLTLAGYAPIATENRADVTRLVSGEKPHLVLLDWCCRYPDSCVADEALELPSPEVRVLLSPSSVGL